MENVLNTAPRFTGASVKALEITFLWNSEFYATLGPKSRICNS